jgi:biofilm PGA synthesis lipoprotein PgaB
MKHTLLKVMPLLLASSLYGSICSAAIAPVANVMVPSSTPVAGIAPVPRVIAPVPLAYSVQIPANQYAVLAFHDIRDDVLAEIDHDPFAISTARIASFFDWIGRHDLHPVSLKMILDAQKGQATLPNNAVLLTFDDGPESNFSHLFPLLRSYHYPALLALQTGWITGDVKIDLYGKAGFVSWSQLREMQASGLVEFATHTHDLHKGIPANPEGNLEPAAITRQYDGVYRRYENESAYIKRIHDDLQYSRQIIHKYLSVSPQAVVWPYGAMNEQTREIAKSVGLPISFSLGDEKLNTLGPSNQPLSRMLVASSPSPVDLEQQMDSVLTPQAKIQRAVEISLDQVYDPDPQQVERKLSALLEQIKAYGIRSVYLKAYSDVDGTGTVTQLYFPNRHLHVRADLFNRVAWQLRTRTDVKVYAVMPLLAFMPPDAAQQQRLAMPTLQDQRSATWPQRLNPLLPETAQLVGDLYEDLGKNAPGINGILIDSDAYAMAAEGAKGGDVVTDFADHAVARMTRYHDASNSFYIARRISSPVLGMPDRPQVTATLRLLLQHYDEVVIQLAAPIQSEASLRMLVKQVTILPQELTKVTFELQTQDAQHHVISSRALASQMQTLISMGAKNIAYTPNDFMNNAPDFSQIYPIFSLNSFPELYKLPQRVGVHDDPSLKPSASTPPMPREGVAP